MKLNTSKGIVTIDFEYSADPSAQNIVTTICRVSVGSTFTYKNIISADFASAVGIATTDSRDRFEKRIGRNITLSRALATLSPRFNNRDFRSEVWRLYRQKARVATSDYINNED